MAILRHVEATPGERAAYLKQALAMRRAQGAEIVEGAADVAEEAEEGAEAVELSRNATRNSAAASSSCSRCPSGVSASAHRPTSTGSRAEAAKASPP